MGFLTGVRFLTADQPGPVYLTVTAAAATLTVTADHGADTAVITLTPTDPADTGAAEAIATARMTDDGGRIRVALPGMTRGATASAAALGARPHALPAPPSVGGAAVTATTTRVRIDATVPAGSWVEVFVVRGSVTMTGPLATAYAEPGPSGADPGPTIDLTGVTTPQGGA